MIGTCRRDKVQTEMKTILKICYKIAISESRKSLYKYIGNEDLQTMKKFVKKLSAMALCTLFATMQVSANQMTGDVLNNNLGGANITGSTGAFDGFTSDGNSANVNVSGDAHIIWGNLNVDKGQGINFNGTTGANATVVNTVTNGMSQIYGSITSNDGIAKLIISNPNGMLYDGASFTTAGDLMLTTQALGVNYVNGNINVNGKYQNPNNAAMITIRNNSDFSVGGEFNIVSPSIEIVKSVIGATKGLSLITADGQNFLVNKTTGQDERHTAVRLESVEINGNVYIAADKDIINIVNGGKIDGNLTIDSDGNLALNYTNNGNQLHITGNADLNNDGRVSYLRNAKVDGNLNMSNSGGFLEINNVEVGKDANLTTTVKTNDGVKHFIHVVGDNKVAGNMNIKSANNIHIGGYNTDEETDTPSDLRKEGSLTVGGDLNAKADYGTIAVTVNTAAKNVKMDAGLNIISDGKATITADTYEFKANHYIGGVNNEDEIVNVMENYLPLPTQGHTYLNIAGGDLNKVETSKDGYALIKSEGDMNVNGVNTGKLLITSNQHNINIGEDVHADIVKVGGETNRLKVEFPSRDYVLKYTNIRDNEVKTINPNDEITYELTNGDNGYNRGNQTADNTYLVGPDKDPITPPGPGPDDPVGPQPNPDDPERNLKYLERDRVSAAIDANEVYTPVAFAADLDEEIDTGVRKNVDGSVTVVRAFTPSN